jgi:hypothetical protein
VLRSGRWQTAGGIRIGLGRLPALGWDIEQPQQYLRYRVGKLLFDDGRMRDAERYFWSFQPYDYFY